MGVPGFFLWLWKKYKKSNFVFSKGKLNDPQMLEKINSIDYLLIDANCLIHPTCFKVLAENPNFANQTSLENKMMDASLEYIDKLIGYANPQKGIYLAIDGVAPVAKIKQQRSRRFKSVHDRALWDNIKKKHGKEVTKFWNNSAITPGTEFMEKLHYKILEWSKKKSLEVIYSSCKTPSEGEHKLLQFIRENIKEDKKFSYVMYGLDADLIFLCLSTNAPDMYLLREASEFDKKNKSDDLNYVSIDIMRSLIKETMEDLIDVEKHEDMIDKKYSNHIINDFIFICYLLGNDFLPHLPALDIYSDGLDILLQKYIELLGNNNYKKFIIERTKNSVKINNKMFREFISYLASEETETLKNSYVTKRKYFKSNSTDPYDVEVHRIDNLQFKVQDPIELGSDEPELWKKRYYKHYFNTDDDEEEEYVNNLVKEYLIGLKWVTNYYFDKCASWTWYYPYNNPPFLEDINLFFEKNKSFNMNKITFEYGSPLKPFNQLLLVLPPQSSYLIPKSLRKIVHNSNSTLAFMYPTQIKQDFIGKRKYWMAHPMLPALDIKLVRKIYYKYEKKISEEEMKRNKKLKVFVFN